MDSFQEEIFARTEKLIGRFSIWRFLLLFATSSLLVFAIMFFALQMEVDPYSIFYVIGVAILYSLMREIYMSKYSKRLMYAYHDYLKELKPDIDLYIPLLSKTGQGFELKKAAIYISAGKYYFEAFTQKKRGIKPTDSITINVAKDLNVDSYYLTNDERFVTFKAVLLNTNYEFSVANIKSLIDLLAAIEGGTK